MYMTLKFLIKDNQTIMRLLVDDEVVVDVTLSKLVHMRLRHIYQDIKIMKEKGEREYIIFKYFRYSLTNFFNTFFI